MIFTGEDTEALSSLGLTGHQSRVYLAVLNQNGISIGEISKQTKIRREDVYRTIPRLEQLGLVEKLLSKPTIIRALPVQHALSNLIDVEQSNSARFSVSLHGFFSPFTDQVEYFIFQHSHFECPCFTIKFHTFGPMSERRDVTKDELFTSDISYQNSA